MSACPVCLMYASVVTVTRKLMNGWVKRYRRCECGHRWSTFEIPSAGIKVPEDERELLREVGNGRSA